MGIYLGLLVGLLSLVLGFLLEGGHLHSLLQGTAALIVFGGTIGAVMVSFPDDIMKNFFKVFAIAFKPYKSNNVELIKLFKEISRTTRKSGLLSIEEMLETSNAIDSYAKKGFRMVIDGVEPNIIKKSLESNIENMAMRHKSHAAMFEAAGGFAPTMGIIGTVLGLVHILGSLDGDPGSLAPKIATAFIATLSGVASANVLWLPVASKLKELNRKEILQKSLILDAVLAIRSGTNPSVLEDQLKNYLSSDELKKYDSSNGSVDFE